MLYRSILRPCSSSSRRRTAHQMARTTSAHRSCRAPAAIGREAVRATALREAAAVGCASRTPWGWPRLHKNGVAARELAALGFWLPRTGHVTHHRQPGNARARLFRLPLDRALVNRPASTTKRGGALPRRLDAGCPLRARHQLARAAPSTSKTRRDYLASFRLVHTHADYLASTSAPRTRPASASFKRADRLASCSGLRMRPRAFLAAAATRPLLVQVAPGLGEGELVRLWSASRSRGAACAASSRRTRRRAAACLRRARGSRREARAAERCPLARSFHALRRQLSVV